MNTKIKYKPTLACILNGHVSCSGVNGEDRCQFDGEPYRLWQFMHCNLCGYVRMFETDEDGKERWEPVDGLPTIPKKRREFKC